MSNMKCPIHDTELAYLDEGVYGHTGCDMTGNTKLWQALIDTKKELEQSEICCTEWEKQALDYKAENIKLSTALEIALDALDYVNGNDTVIHEAIKQINEIKGGK